MSMPVDVISTTGKKTGKIDLPENVFGVEVNIPLIHQVVVAQLAAARQGTHSTKTRAEVSGGGIKPWRQKGTGRARQGSRRSPQWAGGGVVFGPHPRSYAQRTPKKMIAAALRGVLSDRMADGKLFVVDTIVSGDQPSTKAALESLAKVTDYRSALVVLHRDEDVAWLSLRNAAAAHAIAVDQLNVYDVVSNEVVIFTKDAMEDYLLRLGVAVPEEVEASEPEEEAPAKKAATKKPKVEASAVEVEKPAEAEKPAKAEKAEKPAKAKAEVTEEAKPAKAEKPAKTLKADKPAKAADEPKAEPKDYGEGSYRGENPPEGYDIKGNEDSMLFHTPDSPWYKRTIAEIWFNSPEAAKAAGFTDVMEDKK